MKKLSFRQRIKVNRGLARMLKGGVIMDVVTPKQAVLAEKAGAVSVMALERVPADIRASGGVARMSDPALIKKIIKSVSIPVMAKIRIGHFAEAQILQEIGIDFIDESEVLTPADEEFHVDKSKFHVPFVCGATDLGEALRRINEGASMIRTKGEAGTGNIVEAVRHLRAITGGLSFLSRFSSRQMKSFSVKERVPMNLLKEVKKTSKLPVVNFSAGGIATPADASLVMQLGAEGTFVGSGIFKSGSPLKRARAIVEATTNYNNPKVLAKASENIGEAMKGLEISKLEQKYAGRGW